MDYYNTCCNCECDIGGGLRRNSLKAFVKGKKITIGEALIALGIDMIPKPTVLNVCNNCFSAIGKLYNSYQNTRESESKLKKLSSSHSYLGYQFKRFHFDDSSNCRPKKKRKLTNSSVKTDQATQTNTEEERTPQVNKFNKVSINLFNHVQA